MIPTYVYDYINVKLLHCNSLTNVLLTTGVSPDISNAVHITALLGESVVFNCGVDFPGDTPVPYVLQWEKKVSPHSFLICAVLPVFFLLIIIILSSICSLFSFSFFSFPAPIPSDALPPVHFSTTLSTLLGRMHTYTRVNLNRS